MKKAVLLVSVLVLVLSMGAVSAFASDDSGGGVCDMYNADEDLTITAYCDGRINAFDLDEPVAVYYMFEDTTAVNDDGETYATQQMSGISVWGINEDSDGYLAFWVSADEIDAASGDTMLGSAYGFALYYNAEWDVFTVTGPNGYSFSWEA